MPQHLRAPQSTLTDNGTVYTTRLLKGINRFEKLLLTLGIQQKNGRPNHPQTQGKVERFHRTEHLWVNAHPKARSIEELQNILDDFQRVYNTERPHRSLERKTPAEWYHSYAQGAAPSMESYQRPRLSDPARSHRRRWQSHVAPRRSPTPPRGSESQRTQESRDDYRSRGSDCRGSRNPEHPQSPQNRPEPELLARHTENPRPLAGDSR